MSQSSEKAAIDGQTVGETDGESWIHRIIQLSLFRKGLFKKYDTCKKAFFDIPAPPTLISILSLFCLTLSPMSMTNYEISSTVFFSHLTAYANLAMSKSAKKIRNHNWNYCSTLTLTNAGKDEKTPLTELIFNQPF